MTTEVTEVTSDVYIKVADAGSWVAIQNIGIGEISLILADALPLPIDEGFRFKNLDTILPSTYGDANVYVKSINNPSKLAISTE